MSTLDASETPPTGGTGVTKIRIKMGSVEVEYEGSEAFLRDELSTILSGVAQLHKDSPLPPPGAGGAPPLNQTTGSIAAKLNTKGGGELALAGAAYLGLVRQKPTFTRQELLEAMKTAAGRYKRSFSANLSNYLATLTRDGKLLSPGNDTYSLAAATATDIQTRLAAN